MLNLSGLFSRDNSASHAKNIRAVLDRVCRRFAPRLTSRKPMERPPYRRKILFENLEPRLLMSADFNPVAPLGTMVHQSNQSGNLAAPNSTASYTLSLDAGQKISVVLDTQDADLQGEIQLYDIDGTTLLGSADASNPGQMALLDSVVASNAGDYRLDVHNLSGDGEFTLDVFLNATVEIEVAGVSTNDTTAAAQDLTPSAITLPGGGQRYASVGVTQAGAADFYSLNLAQNDVVSIGLAAMQQGAGAALHLELRDSSNTLIAVGDSTASNFDQLILNYKAPSSGSYYLSVSGNGGEDYSLVALNQAGFDVEKNDLSTQARWLHPVFNVLGGLGGLPVGTGGGETGTVGSTSFGFNLFDASGFRWDITGSGSINDGSSDAFDGGISNTSFPGQSSGQLEFGGREVVIGPVSISGLQITRKIYVPTDQSYARFLEIVTNPGATTVNYTLPLYTNLGSDGSEPYVMTSSGDSLTTTDDDWLITDDNASGSSGGDPVVTHVVSGQGGQQRTASFVKGSGQVNYSYALSLAPGETKIIMHFASQAPNQATAVTRAQQLAALQLNELAGMTDVELSEVVNFNLGGQGDQ